MSSQTLPKEKKRIHIDLIFEKGFNLDANYILILDAKQITEKYYKGYIAIDYKDYKIMDEIFFPVETFMIDKNIKHRLKTSSVCGYIPIEDILYDLPIAKKSYDDLYKDLDEKERLELHMIYKIRVTKMERTQNTNPVETVILDTYEFKKHFNWKFNPKTFFKGMVKKFNEPGITEEKLYSGLQKRRAQKRWAKVEFLKKRGISII
jgi:hypothetical protein